MVAFFLSPFFSLGCLKLAESQGQSKGKARVSFEREVEREKPTAILYIRHRLFLVLVFFFFSLLLASDITLVFFKKKLCIFILLHFPRSFLSL